MCQTKSQDLWLLVNLCRQRSSSLLSEAPVWHLVWHLLTLLSLLAHWPIPTFIAAELNTFSLCTLFFSTFVREEAQSACLFSHHTRPLLFSLTLQLGSNLRSRVLSETAPCFSFLFFFTVLGTTAAFSLSRWNSFRRKKSQKAKDVKAFWSRPKMAEVLTPFCASFFSFGGRIPAYNQRQLVDVIFAGICALYLRVRSGKQPTQG